MRYYFLFFLLLVSYSCSREDQNPDSIRIDLSRSYGNEQLESIVDDIRLVPLETNDSCIVGQYDRVIVKGRSIFILDKMQNTVFCFDTTGKFRQKINRQGRSGQEYITADDFIVQDSTLIVFDNNKSQLQFYDFQGNYIKTIPVCQGDQIAVNPAGGYIVYSSVADKYHIHTFNEKGEKTGEYLPVESKIINLPSAFCNNKSILSYNDETFILNFFDYNVYSLKNNELKIKYRYDFGVKNMPDDLLEVSDPASFMQKIAKDKSVQQIENFTETQNWITFDARHPVYYNKNAQVYYVFNELKFPYSLFFWQAPLAINDDNEYLSIVSINQIQALVPAVKKYTGQYPFIETVASASINDNDNNWVLFFRLKNN